MKSRRFLITLFLILLALFLPASADAAWPGDTVTVPVTVSSNTASFVQIEFSYDNNILEFVSAECSIGVASEKGFAAVQLDKIINGKIGTITFRIKDSATSGQSIITANMKSAYAKDETATNATVKIDPVEIQNEITDSTITVSGGLFRIESDNTVQFIGPAGNSSSVAVPDTVTANGHVYLVTSISDKAFYKNTKLKSISIGRNIKTIGKSAFKGCKKLKQVVGGENVVKISDSAFQDCVALTKFTIDENVSSIGKNAFKGCKKLKRITVKTEKLKSDKVGKHAFEDIHDKVVFKCPSKKLSKSYKKIFKKKGAPEGAKYKYK